MVPAVNRRYRIGASSKDIDLNAYGDYNRYADPHLRKYLFRKQVISTKHYVPKARNYYISEPNYNQRPTRKRVSMEKED